MPYFGEQKRKYDNARRLVWRARVLEHLGGKCVVCGTEESLEIHHRNPEEKEHNLAQMWSWRWKLQLVELTKCELRCHTHHLTVHSGKHGGAALYKQGCRCDACVTFKRNYNREYMAQWRATGRDKSRINYIGDIAQPG